MYKIFFSSNLVKSIKYYLFKERVILLREPLFLPFPALGGTVPLHAAISNHH